MVMGCVTDCGFRLDESQCELFVCGFKSSTCSWLCFVVSFESLLCLVVPRLFGMIVYIPSMWFFCVALLPKEMDSACGLFIILFLVGSLTLRYMVVVVVVVNMITLFVFFLLQCTDNCYEY